MKLVQPVASLGKGLSPSATVRHTLLLPFSFNRWHQVSSLGCYVFKLCSRWCSSHHGFTVKVGILPHVPPTVCPGVPETITLEQLYIFTLQQAFISFFFGTLTVSLRLSSRAICNLRSSPRLRRSSWSGTMELEAEGNVDSNTAGHRATLASNRKGPASCGISRENIVQLETMAFHSQRVLLQRLPEVIPATLRHHQNGETKYFI